MRKFANISALICFTFVVSCINRTGYLKITTDPDGARVYVDSLSYAGNTPLLLKKIKSGIHNVRIVHPNPKYVEFNRIVNVGPNDTSIIAVKLQSKTGTLNISSIPNGAHIAITYRNIKIPDRYGLTPANIELPEANYLITLSKGTVDTTFQVTIRKEQETKLKVRLPIQFGCLKISTMPEGAGVALNSTPLSEKTPILLAKIKPGTYDIHIEHPQYFDEKRTIDVLEDDTTSLYVPLKPKYAILNIVTKPKDAFKSVVLKNPYRSYDKQTSPAQFEVPPGNYMLALTKVPLYESIKLPISINSGDTIHIEKELKPIPFLNKKFVHVPAGWFRMGNEKGSDDEKPEHRLYVSEYWISKYEVTVQEYSEFTSATGYPEPKGTKNSTWGKREYQNYPINNISWFDAKAYTKWISKEMKLYVRLPTEAEWERAARWNDSRIFPWGNIWDGTRADFCDIRCKKPWNDTTIDDGYETTSPVGSYENGKSQLGLYDLAGNVNEWCEDSYSPDYYVISPDSDPVNNSALDYKVARGGSWDCFYENLRSTTRFKFKQNESFDSVGFRLIVPARENK